MSGGGEEGFLDRWLRPRAPAGSRGYRDDAALLAPTPGFELVVTADAIVLGVHAFADDPPEAIAAKALAVNLSDLAAKAARPRGCSLALGWDGDPDWAGRVLAAFAREAAAAGCPLLGGDLTRARGVAFLAVTAFGEVRPGRCPSRADGRSGDVLLVSGTLGDAALGLMLRGEPGLARAWGLTERQEAHLLARYLRPRARLALAPVLGTYARASMDLSDGLLGDLARLARASGLAAEVRAEDAPLSPAAARALAADPELARAAVLTGGDDYELLMSVEPGLAAAARAAAARAGVPLMPVGTLVLGPPGEVRASLRGERLSFARLAYSHL